MPHLDFEAGFVDDEEPVAAVGDVSTHSVDAFDIDLYSSQMPIADDILQSHFAGIE